MLRLDRLSLGVGAWAIVTFGLNLAGVAGGHHTLAWLGLAALAGLLVGLALMFKRYQAAWQRQQSLTRQLELRTGDLAHQAAHLASMHEMADCLGSTLRLDEVLLQGAEQVKKVLGVEAVHIRLLSEEERSLDLETAVGASVSFMTEEASVGVGECVCGQVAHTAKPLVVSDLDTDPRVTRVACKKHGFCAVASVPLRSQNRALGVLTVQSRASRLDEPADLAFLTAAGNQLGIAIENAQLYGQMEKRVQQLTRRMEHMVIVQERERVSREIHDGLAQALALLSFRVNVAQSLLAAGQTEQVRKELSEAIQLIDTANHDVREAITALRLTSPKGAEFVHTLEEFVLDFGLRNEIQIHFVAINGIRSVVLSPLIEVQLMRVIQEALTNVRKHARASQALVTLDKHHQRLKVIVQDDGQGFDMDAVLRGQNRKNFGITTMHERVEAIGGCLDITTLVGAGTSVVVTVPMTVKEN